jgi:ribosomal protein S18 acetylase RimI-like enzyme
MTASPAATVRPATPQDLPGLARIAAAALRWDPDAAQLPALLWPSAEPGFALVAEVDGRPAGFALGSLGPESAQPVSAQPASTQPANIRPGAGRRGHVNLLALDPALRRRGLGTALLAALESRLFDAGAAAVLLGGATPTFAWPGVDVRYTAACCLAESRGYERANEAVNMVVELAAASEAGLLATEQDERRLAGEGITVRRLLEADREAISPWLASWGGTWRWETLSTLGGEGAGSHVAVLADGTAEPRYVGFASHGVNRVGWFGPMGTDSALRKSGIGRVLLRRCLADLHAAGLATSDICWVGPVAFYARTVDAHISRVFRLYRKGR